MRVLELAVSGIVREPDYRYAIANPRGVFSAAVLEGRQGGIDGFVFSVNHPALRIIGPLVARPWPSCPWIAASWEFQPFAGVSFPSFLPETD
jgi:hypothetical protein